MQASRNPAKSRPLSANVKRLMRLARASPKNDSIIVLQREFTAREYAYCHKQGNLFMEAASMGIGMEEFAPLFMTSQLAGVCLRRRPGLSVAAHVWLSFGLYPASLALRLLCPPQRSCFVKPYAGG